MRIRDHMLSSVVALFAACVGTLSSAQSFPARPVKVLIGTPAGSGIDVGMRIIGSKVPPQLGQPLVIELRPGADGVIAARQAAGATPDGYTVLAASNGHMAITPVVQQGAGYDPLRDFEPVAMLSRNPSVLVVNIGVPAQDVAQFVRHAKTHTSGLRYGSSSTNYMFAMELFKSLTGVPMQHIPYQGNPQVGSALVGGDVQSAILSLTSVAGLLQGGKLRALAIAGSARDAALPGVPTLAEAGVRGFDIDVWVGMFAPAGTPPQPLAQLGAALRSVLDASDVRDQLARAGIAASWSTPAALRDTVVRDLNTYRTLAVRLAVPEK